MAFDDRIRSAEFISPSGGSFPLNFDAVERSGGKKVAEHEYPQQDRFDVQDLGLQAERFPLSVYFTGPDHDKTAKGFREALAEPVTQDKPAKLKHPRYGNIPVIAVGWSEKEDMVSGLGRTDFTVEFVKVFPKAVFPDTTIAISSALKANAANIQEAVTDGAVDAFSPIDATDVAAVKDAQTGWKESFTDTFSGILAVSAEVQAEADRTIRAITQKIDDITEAPREFFEDVVEVYNLAADTVTDIKEKVEAFKAHIEDLVETTVGTVTQAVSIMHDVACAICAVVRCLDSGSNKSRAEAVTTAEEVEAAHELFVAFSETCEASVTEYRFDPEVMSEIAEAVAMAREELILRSFDLRSERRVSMPAQRTPLDLYYELKGTIDGFEEFLEQNDFQGDEFLLIPAGREVVYYA